MIYGAIQYPMHYFLLYENVVRRIDKRSGNGTGNRHGSVNRFYRIKISLNRPGQPVGRNDNIARSSASF